jgi:aryl-alcohol dehydrogenase-like predicted oxidoreductase
MELRTFGRSGLSVTPLGLGLAALGRPGYINLGHARDLDGNYDVGAMEQKAHKVLDAAWASGIRYFDAARSYGRAELFLSSWLAAHDIPPDNITVGSKWGYTYTAGWNIEADHHEIKEHSLAVLQRQFGESSQLLGSYLSLYQIHSATMDSGVLTNEDVLSELARLRAGGLRIGLSLSGHGQADTLRRAMMIRFDGEPLFSAVQATWNLLTQEAGEALSEASEAGMGVIIKEALANGRLTTRNRESSFADKRTMLEEVAALNETTIDAVALAAVLNQPWVDVVLSGAATVEHLRSNVRALDVKSAFETDELQQYMKETPAYYWTKRSRLAWN